MKLLLKVLLHLVLLPVNIILLVASYILLFLCDHAALFTNLISGLLLFATLLSWTFHSLEIQELIACFALALVVFAIPYAGAWMARKLLMLKCLFGGIVDCL